MKVKQKRSIHIARQRAYQYGVEIVDIVVILAYMIAKFLLISFRYTIGSH